jgi:hypothetical protein
VTIIGRQEDEEIEIERTREDLETGPNEMENEMEKGKDIEKVNWLK